MTFPPVPNHLPRRRKYGTPAIHWNFFLNNDNNYHLDRQKGGGMVSLSARKLAAALWQLQMSDGDPIRGPTGLQSNCGTSDPLELQPDVACVNPSFPSGCGTGECGAEKRDGLQATPEFTSFLKEGLLSKLESFNKRFPSCVMEETTRWDPHPRTSRIPNAIHCAYNRAKNIDDGVTTSLVASALHEEPKLQVRELEADYDSSNRKVAQWLRKLGEERSSRQSREHQKLDAFNGLKKQLHRERKNRQTIEMFHSKLINELENVRSSAEKMRQDYKKERKARKLLETVCYELAVKFGEEKTKFEALKVESIKIQEEIEEERQMLKMAEMWREERVHMKLMDAKSALEDKYCKINKLISELETFLKYQSSNLSLTDIRRLELIRQVSKPVNVQDLKVLSNVSPESCDIHTISEEVRHIEANERTCKPSLGKYAAKDASRIGGASFEGNEYCNIKQSVKHQDLPFNDRGNVEEQALHCRTLSPAEDQASSSFSEGSDVTVKRLTRGKYFYQSEVESEENACRNPPNSKISDICSSSPEQSSRSEIHGTDSSNARFYKVTSHESDGRLLHTIVSGMGTISSKRKSCNRSLGQQNVIGHPRSVNSVNPHVTRAMKGHIKWP